MSGRSACNFAFIRIDQRIPMIPKNWSTKNAITNPCHG